MISNTTRALAVAAFAVIVPLAVHAQGDSTQRSDRRGVVVEVGSVDIPDTEIGGTKPAMAVTVRLGYHDDLTVVQDSFNRFHRGQAVNVVTINGVTRVVP